MSDKTSLIEQLAKGASRRRMLGGVGLGMAAAGAMATGFGRNAQAAADVAATDVEILNFALNLEYLEAQYYVTSVTGEGLPAHLLPGVGNQGAATGARKVNFTNPKIKQIAEEIAHDEYNHVVFLREQLGDLAVAQPTIDLSTSFLTLGQVSKLDFPFDPYASDILFLLGGFVFEDVGVTAYNGAAPLLKNKTFLGYAASILAVEAYHASELRLELLESNMADAADKIAATRAAASGTGPGTSTPADDQGPYFDSRINIVPADTNSLAFARTTGQVLSVVYLEGTTSGGFFPAGVNGPINTAS